MLRKTIFWMHLICGVTVGLVVAMMSLTGALLTYERQMLAWADREHYAQPVPGGERRTMATLLAAVESRSPGFVPTAITLRSDPRAPVAFAAGRSTMWLVNPYTAAVHEPGAPRLRAFFAAVEGWHRWFNATGESRTAARTITGASNLVFLLLVLSGVYLWLPRAFKWAAFKTRLLINSKAHSGKARDFNWHHVFGIWSALPLAVIVASAVVLSYPSASNLVYRSFGEDPPVRAAPRAGAAGEGRDDARTRDGGRAGAPASVGDWGASSERLPYDELFARAALVASDWRSLTLNVPSNAGAATVRFNVDQGNGGQPQLRHVLTLDAATGATRMWQPFSSQSTGQKTRSWIRFLHTGEALGAIGQTIAGIVSITALLMVWTGLALAYRRLIMPLYARASRALIIRE